MHLIGAIDLNCTNGQHQASFCAYFIIAGLFFPHKFEQQMFPSCYLKVTDSVTKPKFIISETTNFYSLWPICAAIGSVLLAAGHLNWQLKLYVWRTDAIYCKSFWFRNRNGNISQLTCLFELNKVAEILQNLIYM